MAVARKMTGGRGEWQPTKCDSLVATEGVDGSFVVELNGNRVLERIKLGGPIRCCSKCVLKDGGVRGQCLRTTEDFDGEVFNCIIGGETHYWKSEQPERFYEVQETDLRNKILKGRIEL